MSESQWVFTQKAARYYGISKPTLRRWADSGKISFRRTPHGYRQYQIGSKPDQELRRDNIIYIRVSSYKQKDDLDRQETFLSEKFPDHQVVRDIGSGLNFRREGLISLLERIEKDSIGEIVVASKDRLCRFGFELIEWICNQHSTELLVLEHNDSTPEEELSSELLDIIQVFCCRRNGKRRYSNQKSKSKNLPKSPSKETAPKMGSP